jgi:hypothetical protein
MYKKIIKRKKRYSLVLSCALLSVWAVVRTSAWKRHLEWFEVRASWGAAGANAGWPSLSRRGRPTSPGLTRFKGNQASRPVGQRPAGQQRKMTVDIS